MPPTKFLKRLTNFVQNRPKEVDEMTTMAGLDQTGLLKEQFGLSLHCLLRLIGPNTLNSVYANLIYIP